MPRGRPPKNKNKEIQVSELRVFKENTTNGKYRCFYCGKEYVEKNFYKTQSKFFSNMGKVPYCKQCIEKFFEYFYEKYKDEGSLNPEKKAVKRLCMAFDIYYSDSAFNGAMESKARRKMNISAIAAYMKMVHLSQYNGKTYDNTILKEEEKEFIASIPDDASVVSDVDNSIKEFFGIGFTDEDYKYLKREYDDWTARHECNTKAQEEVFKDICFNRLQNLKALRRGDDTKDITASFQKMLDAGKLQPKQNKGDTTAETQTFGTLIDKWENTRPLPEIDEELTDVDKIALYINIFFKGHLSKMMGLKNAFSNLYTKYMKKYTVEKPEYESESSDSEALFDAVFGGSLNE